MASVDIEHLKTWVGREEEACDTIDVRLVASFLAAFDRDPSSVVTGQDAPLCIHWCLAPAIVRNSATGPDGHPARGGFLPPVPLPRRMWAGGEVSFVAPLKVGARVTRRSTIESVELKEGRSGQLCFVAVRHLVATDDGLAIDERQDLVYRGAETRRPDPSVGASDGARASGEPSRDDRIDEPGEPDVRRRFETSPLALFRYSALTYNGHRIHYDRRYCLDEEGYRGLVVHGPLQATLLCQLGAEMLGRTPAVFSYRGVRPLFDDEMLSLDARRRNGGAELWSSGADGVVRMRASAR